MHAANARRANSRNRNKPYKRAGAVIVAASTCWLSGISFVGTVHVTKDPAARLAMLQRSRGRWVAGQFLAAAGTMAVPVGFVRFARPSGPGPPRTLPREPRPPCLPVHRCSLLPSPDRAADLEKFAYRRGPNWPFLTYAGLHIGALAALGPALLLLPLKPWSGATAVAGVPVFGAILAGTKDIPPFVFYLVEAAVGVQLMRYEEAGLPPGGQRRGESRG